MVTCIIRVSGFGEETKKLASAPTVGEKIKFNGRSVRVESTYTLNDDSVLVSCKALRTVLGG